MSWPGWTSTPASTGTKMDRRCSTRRQKGKGISKADKEHDGLENVPLSKNSVNKLRKTDVDNFSCVLFHCSLVLPKNAASLEASSLLAKAPATTG